MQRVVLEQPSEHSVVVGTDPVDAEDSGPRGKLRADAKGTSKTLGPSPSAKRVLEGHAGGLEARCKLLGQRSGDQAPEHVAQDKAADTTIGFLQRDKATYRARASRIGGGSEAAASR